MFHKLVFSDLTKKRDRVKKAFIRSWSGTKTRLKMSDEAAKVQRKTLQDLQKSWRTIAQEYSKNNKNRAMHGNLRLNLK